MKPASVFEFQDYRDFLKAELASKCTDRKKFSLRSMARFLGLSPSYLSATLLKKRNISLERASDIGRKLKLESRELEYFLGLVEIARTKSDLSRTDALLRLKRDAPRPRPKKLRPDQFVPFADWCSMALLEICAVTPMDGKAPANGLANQFGVSAEEINRTLRRMASIGLLEKTADGVFMRPKDEVRVSSEMPNSVLRDYHRQVAERGLSALQSLSTDARYTSSAFLPFSEKDFPCVRRVVDEFLDRLHDLASRSDPADRVYGLSVNFFEVFRRE